MASPSLSSFVRNQRELLQLERDEERKMLGDKLSSLSSKACESEGLSILHLEIESIRSGLYGRTVASLHRLDKKPLPVNSFKVGDEIRLYSPKLQFTPAAESSTANCVITRVSANHIEVVTENDVDEPSFPSPLRVDMLANEGTHKKMMTALAELESMQDSQTWPLANILFGEGATGDVQSVKITPFNAGLNSSQIEAIEHALGSPFLAAIHGPPGTGKTTAVTELILQAVARRQKVLVCAPSNVAVDNILEKIVSFDRNNVPSSSSSTSAQQQPPPKPQVVRLGHPARVNPAIQQYCLEALITSDDGTEIVNDVRHEIDQLRRAIGKSRDKSHKRELSGEMRVLRKEARKREEGVVSSILKSRDVVLATCVGASNKLLRQLEIPFDLVIIDEAAQALEASCWVPMLHARKVVLAGDHCQLPPTVKSKEATKRGLAVTLFERVVTDKSRLGATARMLNVQYRMNEVICGWASASMYHSELSSHASVAGHTLRGLLDGPQRPHPHHHAAPSSSISTSPGSTGEIPVALLIDTAGCLMDEDDNTNTNTAATSTKSVSHRNHREAEVVARHVLWLLASGLRPDQVGVITPYNGQLEVLRGLLHPAHQGVEIRTVDGFQGGEKEAIVLSFVRSNARREVGFLSDKRRINVAVTRARRHLAIICDSETCCSDSFIRGLIEHISDKGEHRSALDDRLDDLDDDDASEPGPSTSTAAAAAAAAAAAGAAAAGAAGAATAVEAQGAASVEAVGAAPSKARKSRAEQKRLAKQGDATTSAKLMPGKETAERAAFDNALYSLVRQFASGGVAGGRVEFHPPSSLEVIASQELKKGKSNKIGSGMRRLRFPSTLNSYQRQCVHALSDELGLTHESHGMAMERYIEIALEVRPEVPEELAKGAEEREEEKEEVKTAVAPSSKEAPEASDSSDDDDDDEDDDGGGKVSSSATTASAATSAGNNNSNSSQKKKKKAKKSSAPAPQTGAAGAGGGGGKNVLGSAALPPSQLPPTHPSFRTRPPPSSAHLTAALAQDLDEMALLDAAIRDNEANKKANQFRIGSTPMPNPERERAKAALHSKIQGAKADRSSSSAAEKEGADERPMPRPKAVLKKPFKQLDGMRLGRPEDKA